MRRVVLAALFATAAASSPTIVAKHFPFISAAEECTSPHPCADACLTWGIRDDHHLACDTCWEDYPADQLFECFARVRKRIENEPDWELDITHPGLLKLHQAVTRSNHPNSCCDVAKLEFEPTSPIGPIVDSLERCGVAYIKGLLPVSTVAKANTASRAFAADNTTFSEFYNSGGGDDSAQVHGTELNLRGRRFEVVPPATPEFLSVVKEAEQSVLSEVNVCQLIGELSRSLQGFGRANNVPGCCI
eukprot:TRINITY_DN2941_c0_g1_i7.p1 TRINITY_DN2941_c0_g1~~TRINITY_DN2941_c0_g1_i7.p1  ORF type:complete len:246 (-),score=41.78 TRINITY_DN2941_c0_g1_i7:808-1545(-)